MVNSICVLPVMFFWSRSSGEETPESHLWKQRERFVQLHPQLQTSSRIPRGLWEHSRTFVQDGYRHTHLHRRLQDSSDGGEDNELDLSLTSAAGMKCFNLSISIQKQLGKIIQKPCSMGPGIILPVFLQPGHPASHRHRQPITPHRPKTDDRSGIPRFPLFDREPFRPVTEFFPQFDIKDTTNHVVVTGAIGPAGPTLRAPPEEKTPTPFPPPLHHSDTGNCLWTSGTEGKCF